MRKLIVLLASGLVAGALLFPSLSLAQGKGPTSIRQCLNGGWEEFGFDSLGQCIQYVVRHNMPTPPPHPTRPPHPSVSPLPTPGQPGGEV